MQLTRPEIRRAAKDKGNTAGLNIEADEYYVLKRPQHWHVDVLVYAYQRGEEYVDAVHMHSLVSNDVALATTKAVKMVSHMNGPERKNYRIEQVTQCSEITHLEGIDG